MQEASPDPPQLQSHRQIPDGDDEARIHRRVRMRRRPQSRLVGGFNDFVNALHRDSQEP